MEKIRWFISWRDMAPSVTSCAQQLPCPEDKIVCLSSFLCGQPPLVHVLQIPAWGTPEAGFIRGCDGSQVRCLLLCGPHHMLVYPAVPAGNGQEPQVSRVLLQSLPRSR